MPRLPQVVLLIESSRSSGRDLLLGIAEYARQHGPWAFCWEPGGLEKAWPRIRKLNADGIILRDGENVSEVLASGIPAIVIGHNRPAIPQLANVITDSALVGELAAEHLLDCGFAHFAFCGFPNLPWSQQRAQSFAARLRRQRTTPFLHHVSPPFTEPTALAQTAAWLSELPKPIGIMAGNDDLGRHVIESCKLAELKVPEHVGVIGADNDQLICELTDPPMSSVAINFQRAGYESAQLLHRLIKGNRRAGQNILVEPTHVIPRQSTDMLFMNDAAVSRALRFIRYHSREDIRVDAVVQASGLSRRCLEKRFRSVVGRSVLEEIRRQRVDQISRLLIETDHTVSAIAHATGFQGAEHVARYFRHQKKMTPVAYRKVFGCSPRTDATADDKKRSLKKSTTHKSLKAEAA